MFFNELISGLRTGELVSFDDRMLFFVVDDSKLKIKVIGYYSQRKRALDRSVSFGVFSLHLLSDISVSMSTARSDNVVSALLHPPQINHAFVGWRL